MCEREDLNWSSNHREVARTDEMSFSGVIGIADGRMLLRVERCRLLQTHRETQSQETLFLSTALLVYGLLPDPPRSWR